MSDLRDPDTIERQNDALRSDMGRTIEALEQKLSPGQLLDRALGMVKEHGGEWASNLGSTTKQNPVPSILTAVGIAWLMASSNRPGLRGDDTGRGAHWKERFDGAGERIGDARSAVSGAAHRLGDKVADTRDRLRGTADSMRHSAHRTAERTRDVGTQLRSTMEEQPLLMGAMGIALGALLGSLLPRTDREDQLLGDARDRMFDKARTAGEHEYEEIRDTVDRVMSQPPEEQRPH
jgi:ElaB/YqjD/DUF883 family membrane-anchored ribosome-binding protein